MREYFIPCEITDEVSYEIDYIKTEIEQCLKPYSHHTNKRRKPVIPFLSTQKRGDSLSYFKDTNKLGPGEYDPSVKHFKSQPLVQTQPFTSKVTRMLPVSSVKSPESTFSMDRELEKWCKGVTIGCKRPQGKVHSNSTDTEYYIENDTIKQRVLDEIEQGPSATFLMSESRFEEPVIFYSDKKENPRRKKQLFRGKLRKANAQVKAATTHQKNQISNTKSLPAGEDVTGVKSTKVVTPLVDKVFTESPMERDAKEWRHDYCKLSAPFQSKVARMKDSTPDPWGADATLGLDLTSWRRGGAVFPSQTYEGRGDIITQIKATLPPRPKTSHSRRDEPPHSGVDMRPRVVARPSSSKKSTTTTSGTTSQLPRPYTANNNIPKRVHRKQRETMADMFCTVDRKDFKSSSDFEAKLCEEYLNLRTIKKNSNWTCLTEADKKIHISEKQALQKYLLGL